MHCSSLTENTNSCCDHPASLTCCACSCSSGGAAAEDEGREATEEHEEEDVVQQVGRFSTSQTAASWLPDGERSSQT